MNKILTTSSSATTEDDEPLSCLMDLVALQASIPGRKAHTFPMAFSQNHGNAQVSRSPTRGHHFIHTLPRVQSHLISWQPL